MANSRSIDRPGTPPAGRGGAQLPPPRVLNDPKTIRALAHPARVAALEAFSGGDELTATQLAERAGLSPSAMSYHLRALEKVGLVERAESIDGRERPWRAYPGGWTTTEVGTPAAAAATSALTQSVLDRTRNELMTWFDHEREQPEAWRRAAGFDNNRIWLTAQEMAELRELQQAYVDERRGRSAAHRPEGARRVRVLLVTTPLTLD